MSKTLVMPPVPADPAALDVYFRGLLRDYRTYRLRWAVLLSFACHPDATGRGLDAAEARAGAGRLTVRYRWRHRPTGLVSDRVFAGRRSAWMWLGRLAKSPDLRARAARPGGLVGVDVTVPAPGLRWPSGRPADRAEFPVDYHRPGRYDLRLSAADMELVAVIAAGYTAPVRVPGAVDLGFNSWSTGASGRVTRPV